jgi:hypothetical protein
MHVRAGTTHQNVEHFRFRARQMNDVTFDERPAMGAVQRDRTHTDDPVRLGST